MLRCRSPVGPFRLVCAIIIVYPYLNPHYARVRWEPSGKIQLAMNLSISLKVQFIPGNHMARPFRLTR